MHADRVAATSFCHFCHATGAIAGSWVRHIVETARRCAVQYDAVQEITRIVWMQRNTEGYLGMLVSI